MAKEKLESTKIIINNSKELNLTQNNVKSINATNAHTLNRNNEEISQDNLELNKNNSILLSEKLLLEKELKLCDKNNEDSRNKIRNLEINLDRETNAKESEKLTNHGLKQTLIDVSGKSDLLVRENKKYKDDMSDLIKEDTHLNDTTNDVKNQFISSEKNVDELRNSNALANSELNEKTQELENMKQDASDMTLNFETELISLNKM